MQINAITPLYTQRTTKVGFKANEQQKQTPAEAVHNILECNYYDGAEYAHNIALQGAKGQLIHEKLYDSSISRTMIADIIREMPEHSTRDQIANTISQPL